MRLREGSIHADRKSRKTLKQIAVEWTWAGRAKTRISRQKKVMCSQNEGVS